MHLLKTVNITDLYHYLYMLGKSLVGEMSNMLGKSLVGEMSCQGNVWLPTKSQTALYLKSVTEKESIRCSAVP